MLISVQKENVCVISLNGSKLLTHCLTVYFDVARQHDETSTRHSCESVIVSGFRNVKTNILNF